MPSRSDPHLPAPTGAAPMPGPRLDESPAQLDCGDRRVQVLLAMPLPRMVLLGKLLSAEECDALIAFAAPRMARALTVDTQTGGEELHHDRTSNGMFFDRGENPLIQRALLHKTLFFQIAAFSERFLLL